MKRTKTLVLALILCLALGTTAFAADLDRDTLADWGISVVQPPRSVAILDGTDGCYYIYPQKSGSIPYVMIYVYDGYENEEEAADGVIRMMADNYADLSLVYGPMEDEVGGRDCVEIGMTYHAGENEIQDRRVFIEKNDRVYMFVSKEVADLDLTVGTLLDDTVRTCVFEGEEKGGDVELPKEQEPIPEGGMDMKWEDVLEELGEENIDGEFVTFDEIGMKMLIPSGFEALEMTDEMRELYYLGFFTSDQDTLSPGISVQYVDTLGISDFAGYKELIESLGDAVELINEGNINGIHFLVYSLGANESMVVGTVIDGGIVEFAFSPISNGDFMALAELSACSIQKAEESKSFLPIGEAEQPGVPSFFGGGALGNDPLTSESNEAEELPNQEEGDEIFRKMSEYFQEQEEGDEIFRKMSEFFQEQEEGLEIFRKMSEYFQEQEEGLEIFRKMSEYFQEQEEGSEIFRQMSEYFQEQEEGSEIFRKMSEFFQE